MSANPPLPDYLDVDAGEIEDEHLRDAGRAIAGYWPELCWNRRQIASSRKSAGISGFIGNVPRTDEPGVHLGPTYFRTDFITPLACIARWAGEDAERWREIALELMWPDEPWLEMPVGICTQGDQKSAVAMLYIVANAKPHQLYRALVNVAWDEWREEYNKRREAEGGTR